VTTQSVVNSGENKRQEIFSRTGNDFFHTSSKNNVSNHGSTQPNVISNVTPQRTSISPQKRADESKSKTNLQSNLCNSEIMEDQDSNALVTEKNTGTRNTQ